MKILRMFPCTLQVELFMKLVEAVAAMIALMLLMSALCTPAREILRIKKAVSEERYALYMRRDASYESNSAEGGYIEYESFP